MRHVDRLMELLQPLRIYQQEGPLHRGELTAVGEALDGVMNQTLELEREMLLVTAADWGVERVAQLFPRRPVTKTTEELRAAVAALSRIGGDSFTLEAINDALLGCGIDALALEIGVPGRVKIMFPGVGGVPDRFEEVSAIIEEILPAHLLIEYHFWYINWRQLEQEFPSWRELEGELRSWGALEMLWRQLAQEFQSWRALRGVGRSWDALEIFGS